MKTMTERSLHWEAASAVARAAVAHAEELGVRIHVSVVDRAGLPLAYLRMNGAFLHSQGIAEDKAYTAASFGFSTRDWLEVLGDNPRLRIGLPRRERLVVFGGGLPILLDGECIGGIGVSGASEEQDEACAESGLRALREPGYTTID
ncbi:ATP:cob(I)alamin adenosyltransferase [Pseudomonas taeanensis MS-3]|uniref:ATP:cob(I)alamin adenosyltransferase n=1 Tax=Pseudomonas taeanensis MS-3 TaxID=1395571 RepID=A0A0A1YFI7_9PSED|nr:heme-binding protein [Pseudomonas taeanensis]KFX67379.1 ATP:cob(I)alamin adenosyltransferase [Pseudomonas taeanensis MS-3]